MCRIFVYCAASQFWPWCYLAVPVHVLALTIGEERNIGEYLLFAIRKELPVLEDPDISQYINTLGRKVLATVGPSRPVHSLSSMRACRRVSTCGSPSPCSYQESVPRDVVHLTGQHRRRTWEISLPVRPSFIYNNGMSTITRPHTSEMPRPPHDGRRGSQPSPQTARPTLPRRRRWPWLLLVGTVIAVGIGVLVRRSGSSLQTDGALVLYEVKPTDLEVMVTERGNLESQLDLQVLCEVDDVSGDGINGTPIVWIVENGASVKKDDVLVELDSTPLRDRLDEQQLAVQSAARPTFRPSRSTRIS